VSDSLSSPPTQPPLAPAPAPASSEPAQPWYKSPVGFGVVTGLLYGLVIQIAARTKAKELMAVMSLGFVFILPFAIGFLTAHWGGYRKKRSIFFYMSMPGLTAMACMVAAMILGWEGLICMVLATPVYLFMASMGGFFAWLFHQMVQDHNRVSALVSSFVFIAPPATALYEHGRPAPVELHKVHTEIAIDASRDMVWSKIIRVEPIVEPTTGVFYKMGFPRPIEASLSREGTGGVRHARFEKDLVFIETVDEWVDKERLSFAIDVDPSKTPLTTLDPHVTVGGEYFDVMRGTYWIEDRPGGVMLHLESEFRLSTDFNRYAGLWGDFLMRDIQTSILRVLKERCEKR
jgi:hypothetical protein